MAWTAKSIRFTGKDGSNPVVGPGSYNNLPQKREAEPGFAPFGSFKERDPRDEPAPSKNTVSEQYRVPAPGEYDPKLPSKYDSGLPRKAVPFHSSSSRGELHPQNKNARAGIGPGTYELLEKPKRSEASRTMGDPKASQPSMFRSASAPSIPRGHLCFGYEEAGDGRLLRQPPKNLAQLMSGIGAETAGPGHYETIGKPSIAKKAQNVVMGTSPSRAPTKNVDTPGPGHYADRTNQSGRHPQSSFSSGTVRMAPAVGWPKSEELPGPGSYAQTWQGPKNRREVNPELQFFGSTDERFKGSKTNGGVAVPGPGQYEAPIVKQARPPAKTSFTTELRFKGPAEQTPGPGGYDNDVQWKTSGPLGTASILGSTGSLAFGSMQSRNYGGFSEVRQKNPGPGNYETVSVPEHGAPQGQLRTGRVALQNAVFASDSAQDGMLKTAIKESKKVPPVGQYTPVISKDTSAVMRLPPKKEGFLSTAPRMDAAKTNAAPGPGRYNPVGTTDQLTGGKRLGTYNRAIVEGVRGGLGFGNAQKRFSKESKLAPGPGAYESEQSLVQKSHNVHFGEVA